MTTDREIARWRLRSQYFVSPHAASAAPVIRSLLAVQAESPSQAAWAVACRAQHRDASELEALLDQGSVVRTHVLRPTWHFVAAEDIGWLLELTAPRSLCRPGSLTSAAMPGTSATAHRPTRSAR